MLDNSILHELPDSCMRCAYVLSAISPLHVEVCRSAKHEFLELSFYCVGILDHDAWVGLDLTLKCPFGWLRFLHRSGFLLRCGAMVMYVAKLRLSGSSHRLTEVAGPLGFFLSAWLAPVFKEGDLGVASLAAFIFTPSIVAKPGAIGIRHGTVV